MLPAMLPAMHRLRAPLHRALTVAPLFRRGLSRYSPPGLPACTRHYSITRVVRLPITRNNPFIPKRSPPHPPPRAFFSSRQRWPAPTRLPSRLPSRDGYIHFAPRTPPSPANLRYILVFTVAGAAIYIYTNLDYAPFTGRARLLGVSRDTELRLGHEAFEDILHTFHGHVLPPSHPQSRRVRNVVRTIATVAAGLDSRLVDGFEWRVVVVDAPAPNALCAPGGRILITTSLLAILPRDDDVAVVLAHEIAHAINRHGAESMHLQRLLLPLILLLNQLFDLRWVPSVLTTLLLSLPYARRLEHEADDVGLMLCAEACYDPRVAPAVFRRLGALQQESTGSFFSDRVAPFLSTHPQTAERSRRLKAAVPDRLERYRDKCGGGKFAQFSRDYGGAFLSGGIERF